MLYNTSVSSCRQRVAALMDFGWGYFEHKRPSATRTPVQTGRRGLEAGLQSLMSLPHGLATQRRHPRPYEEGVVARQAVRNRIYASQRVDEVLGSYVARLLNGLIAYVYEYRDPTDGTPDYLSYEWLLATQVVGDIIRHPDVVRAALVMHTNGLDLVGGNPSDPEPVGGPPVLRDSTLAWFNSAVLSAINS